MRPVDLIKAAAPVVVSRRLYRVAGRGGAGERPDIPERERSDPGMCRAAATCVHDPTPGERPGGRRDSNSVAGCGLTWEALHGTWAGRTRESVEKFLLRDHAPLQREVSWEVVAKKWLADGALFVPWRAELRPRRHGAVWLVGAPPASAGPAAGIRRPGSNAGSNTGACTCAHSLCAGKSVVAAAGGRLAYDDDSPRELRSQGSARGER